MTFQPKTLADVLVATGPDRALAEHLNLFGQFIGAWDLKWRGMGLDGNEVTVRGELHFGWILGGRAVQDVWHVPVDAADAERMRAFHGSTIRFYDPALGAWRSTWIDPLNGRVRRFIGRSEGDRIVLEGLDEDPRERWSFNDITPDSFIWRGEESTDGGETWILNDVMYSTRRAAQ